MSKEKGQLNYKMVFESFLKKKAKEEGLSSPSEIETFLDSSNNQSLNKSPEKKKLPELAQVVHLHLNGKNGSAKKHPVLAPKKKT